MDNLTSLEYKFLFPFAPDDGRQWHGMRRVERESDVGGGRKTWRKFKMNYISANGRAFATSHFSSMNAQSSTAVAMVRRKKIQLEGNTSGRRLWRHRT